MTTSTEAEVWYHGTGSGAGPRPIVTEDADGNMTGVLHHVVRHSPTGMSWGYAGSGPADTARSILLAALGPAAICPDCAGTGKVTYPRDEEEADPKPYDITVSPEEYESAGIEVTGCWRHNCDGGYLRVPYQDFKFAFVAGWGPEFRISRSEILAWLAAEPGRWEH